MKRKALLFSTIAVLFALKGNGQGYSLELSNQVFRNTLTNQDITLFEYKGDFNISSQLLIVRSTKIGEFYTGIGYSTFNYITKLNIEEFDSPSDPAFDNSLHDTRRNKGHRYISIPLGFRKSLSEKFFIPIETLLNLGIENRSNLFQNRFLSFNLGVGYKQPLNENLDLLIVPTFGLNVNAIDGPFVSMPLLYGLRFNLNYKL